MEIVLFIGFLVIMYFLYTGIRGRKLFKKLHKQLISEPGWSEDRIHHVWMKHNKEIIDMELRGMTPDQIAEELKSSKYL